LSEYLDLVRIPVKVSGTRGSKKPDFRRIRVSSLSYLAVSHVAKSTHQMGLDRKILIQYHAVLQLGGRDIDGDSSEGLRIVNAATDVWEHVHQIVPVHTHCIDAEVSEQTWDLRSHGLEDIHQAVGRANHFPAIYLSVYVSIHT
jgi:hypothetical protein